MKSIKCCPFLFDALCRLYLLFLFFPICTTFNGNPKATIISCYSPTNVSEENEIVTFYEDLSSLVRSIPKHNLYL